MEDNIIDKMLGVLREKGWVKGKMYVPEKGYCIRGANRYTRGHYNIHYTGATRTRDGSDGEYEVIVETIRQQFPERKPYPVEIPAEIIIEVFNDDPQIQFSDIEQVLEKAAIKWEERKLT